MQTKSTEIVRKMQHEYSLHASELVELLDMHGKMQSIEFNAETNEITVVTTEEQVSAAVGTQDLSFRTYQHVSSDGRTVQLQDMAYSHLVNCYNKYGNEQYLQEMQFRNNA